MGLHHGVHWNYDKKPLCNLYLSLLHAMGIPASSFGDSTGTLAEGVFDSMQLAKAN